jgi:predicted esterase
MVRFLSRSWTRAGAAAALVAGLAAPLAAAPGGDDRPPEVGDIAKVKPGDTVLLTAPKGMRYFLRVPKKFDAKAGRLIVFLHGSSMNGLDYLRSFEAMGWAKDDLLACPNGETGSDPFGANNFTFASAPLVADVTEQVQGRFKPSVTYVGGHSQGGFLTFSVILLHPDLYRGAIPMAGDCWSQNEPNLWEDDEKTLAKQQQIAIAVIHGKADPVVPFSQGQHAYDVFRAMGWPKLRLFAPEQLGHQFMLSPVGEALEWLDAMNGREEKRSLELARDWAEQGEWGWARQVAQAAKSPKLVKDAEAAATKAAAAMTEAMKRKPVVWVPEWLEFWRVHGGTAAAKPLVDKYLSKRDKQRNDGKRLFDLAWSAARDDDRAKRDERLNELLEEAPCTFEAYYAWSWLTAKP